MTHAKVTHCCLLLTGAQGDGFLADTSDSEGEERDEGRRANFRLDDWIHFKADAEVSLHY